jgi:hypothetical protein
MYCTSGIDPEKKISVGGPAVLDLFAAKRDVSTTPCALTEGWRQRNTALSAKKRAGSGSG